MVITMCLHADKKIQMQCWKNLMSLWIEGFDLSSIRWAHVEIEMGTIKLGDTRDIVVGRILKNVVYDCLLK